MHVSACVVKMGHSLKFQCESVLLSVSLIASVNEYQCTFGSDSKYECPYKSVSVTVSVSVSSTAIKGW